MDIRKLQRAIVDGLEDVKAQDITVFNTEHLSPLFERVIIASGTSNRQTKALASSVRETVKQRGMDVLRTEGEDNGEWIIVDCGAAVAHIMQPAIRDYYHLEEIWGGLVKASEPEPAASAPKKAAARPAGSTKAPAKKPPARKAATGHSATAAAGTARKSAPGKSAPGKSAPRKTDAQKQADRTAAYLRVAAKSPARKAAAKAPAAKKVAKPAATRKPGRA
jgi:ribosome-associated protein